MKINGFGQKVANQPKVSTENLTPLQSVNRMYAEIEATKKQLEDHYSGDKRSPDVYALQVQYQKLQLNATNASDKLRSEITLAHDGEGMLV